MTGAPISYAKLYEEASQRLDSEDAWLLEKAEVVCALARALGAVSVYRVSVNNDLHLRLCAALVVAYEKDQPFMLPTRCRVDLHKLGLSSTTTSFLDRSVFHGLLKSETKSKQAIGKLYLTDLLQTYLSAETSIAA